MSIVMNGEVIMHCKSVTANLLKVVGILVEPSIDIVKPKGHIEAYLSIGQPHITVTSSSPVIYPSLYISFFFSSMLRSISRSRQSIV